MSGIPQKPSLDGLEARWSAVWEENGTYRFDRSRERGEIFSIDTPPPTVSGSLHMGSAFGYVQTDSIARYQRMRGRHVFYPMGWDDNGLPTERRVQNYFGVRCEPHLQYDPAFVPPEKPGKDVVPISRPNFLELCEKLVAEDEAAFEDLWRRLGLSVDWSLTYTTVGHAARRTGPAVHVQPHARQRARSSTPPPSCAGGRGPGRRARHRPIRTPDRAQPRRRAPATCRPANPGPALGRRSRCRGRPRRSHPGPDP